MRVIYPYNEVLPKRTAHDVYIVRNCASLAREECQVELLCGWGGLSGESFYHHYEIQPTAQLSVRRLPIFRKVGPLSFNKLFFWASQRQIARAPSGIVITSVYKQAAHHIKRKRQGIKYVFEVHQLGWYPNQGNAKEQQVLWERQILSQMDLVTVTTHALKRILQQAPYSLHCPIEVVPLAVDAMPLPPPPDQQPFTVCYVGQLYKSQGVELLLKALAQAPGVLVEVVGGKPEEIAALQEVARQNGVSDRVRWHGFIAPPAIPAIAQRAHVFVAPFLATERMPYVAHTKLLEYASWGRPVIAPNLPVVHEHSQDMHLFEPDSWESLAECLKDVSRKRQTVQSHVDYSWSKRSSDYRQLLRDLVRK